MAATPTPWAKSWSCCLASMSSSMIGRNCWPLLAKNSTTACLRLSLSGMYASIRWSPWKEDFEHPNPNAGFSFQGATCFSTFNYRRDSFFFFAWPRTFDFWRRNEAHEPATAKSSGKTVDSLVSVFCTFPLAGLPGIDFIAFTLCAKIDQWPQSQQAPHHRDNNKYPQRFRMLSGRQWPFSLNGRGAGRLGSSARERYSQMASILRWRFRRCLGNSISV